MESTKGHWKDKDGLIVANEVNWVTNEVARVYFKNPTTEELANAQLIAAAINACIKVNPDNPQAVAEGIGGLYEALKELLNGLGNPMEIPPYELVEHASKALARAEGG